MLRRRRRSVDPSPPRRRPPPTSIMCSQWAMAIRRTATSSSIRRIIHSADQSICAPYAAIGRVESITECTGKKNINLAEVFMTKIRQLFNSQLPPSKCTCRETSSAVSFYKVYTLKSNRYQSIPRLHTRIARSLK